MLGLIPHVLLDLVEARGGAHQVTAVKERAGIPEGRKYRLGDAYPDEECLALLEATCAELGMSQSAAEAAFSEHFIKDAVTRWPTWFEMAEGAYAFLTQVPIFHNALSSGIEDASQRAAIEDKFSISALPGELILTYRSANALCGLCRELAQGILEHYGEEAEVQEIACSQQGADECQYRILWPQESGK